MPLILSLCDLTGNWSRPYAEAGYTVVRVDLQAGEDVRLMRRIDEPVQGILAAPPCTHFARSGAPHWHRKGDAELLEGLSVVDACLRMVLVHRPTWWVLENPVGRLKDYLGEPAFRFDPCDFGVLSDSADRDAYTKRTWLWGNFTPPIPLLCGCDPATSVAPMKGRVGGRDRTTLFGSRNRVARHDTQTPEA